MGGLLSHPFVLHLEIVLWNTVRSNPNSEFQIVMNGRLDVSTSWYIYLNTFNKFKSLAFRCSGNDDSLCVWRTRFDVFTKTWQLVHHNPTSQTCQSPPTRTTFNNQCWQEDALGEISLPNIANISTIPHSILCTVYIPQRSVCLRACKTLRR